MTHHEDDTENDPLKDGFENLGRLIRGAASKVVGPIATENGDPETLITPEVDGAIEHLGHTVGHWMRAAGTGMKEAPTNPEAAIRKAAKAVTNTPIETQADDQGWSPLLQGTRTLFRGISAVTKGLAEELAPDPQEVSSPKEETADSEEEPPSDAEEVLDSDE
jgi:hypothetical protein